MFRSEKIKQSYFPIAFFVLVTLLLFFVRLASFNKYILNTDELEWLYGINRTWIEPAPFIGFEAHTSGPLSIYILSLIKLFVASPDALDLRLFGFLFLITPTLAILYWGKKGYLNVVGLVYLFSLLTIYVQDFYSYNSEYQIMLFTAILYQLLMSELNLWRVISFACFLVLFFFIKIQVAFLLLFFALTMTLKLVFAKHFRLLGIYVATGIFMLAAIVFYLWETNALKEAIYLYIEKNVLYQSQASDSEFNWYAILKNFISKEYSYFFYPLLVIAASFVILIAYQKKSFGFGIKFLNEILGSKLLISLLLLITSWGTILISKNNFEHYYIISFFPLAALFSEIYYLLEVRNILSKVKMAYFSFIIISFLLAFNFNNLYNSFQLLSASPKDRTKYQLGDRISANENRRTKEYLLHNRMASDPTILALGWYDSQMLYYELYNTFSPIYRSANFYWYLSTFEQGSDYLFKHEEANLMEDLRKRPPYYIVDCEGLLEKIQGTQFSTYVQLNYELVKNDHQSNIYRKHH